MNPTDTSSSPTHTSEMINQPIRTLFWRYCIPTIMSMLITGIYVTVDGMFVGHFLGEQGLAGMMLAFPVGSLLYAVGALVGMGAAALVSINLGQGDKEKARQFVGNALSLCLISGVILGILGTFFSTPILALLGAEGEILIKADKYLFWHFALGVFPIISMAFTALVRNDGRPGFVTWVLILGGVINVFLDWLLVVVWPYGLAGAAIATMLSQAVTGLLCLGHFFSRHTELRLSWQQMQLTLENCAHIARVGFPSFLMNLYLSLVLTMHNMAFLWVGAPIHVAAFGVISYTEALFYLVFEGIAFGLQPILSFNAGAGRYDRVLEARRLGFMMALLVAVIGLVIIYSHPDWLVYLFAGNNPQLAPVAIEGMRLYFWGLPLEGLLLVGASFFQAINCSREASVLTALKLVLIALMMSALAWFFGTTGVWVSLAICSVILCIWMCFAMKRVDRRHQA